MARYSKASKAEETLTAIKPDVNKAYRITRDPAVKKILKRVVDQMADQSPKRFSDQMENQSSVG